MKARLLHRDRDFDWQWALRAAARREATRRGRRYTGEEIDTGVVLPWNAQMLTDDLALDTLFAAMAAEDECILDVVQRVILSATQGDGETIRYRQAVLRDCLHHPRVVRKLYALATEAMKEQSKHYFGAFMARHPDSVLRRSLETLDGLLACIVELRSLADSHHAVFGSEGWRGLFEMLRRELSDDYLEGLRYHIARLRFRNGVLLSARLGEGNTGTDYVLHPPPGRGASWLRRAAERYLPSLTPPRSSVYSFSLHPRDEPGFRALGGVRNRGIAIAAAALGQSADHVRSFFAMLRTELAFYIGCMNLYDLLARTGSATCFPTSAPAGERRLSARGLYDVCLGLTMKRGVVGNDVDATGKDLIIVTGANQGGKSTFLRSIGLAQLMMQAGMFVPAESFVSSICDGLFTHCKREEDAAMVSGKLDEELARMSDVVDHITSDPIILCNESFSSTNELEGSEIAKQVTRALIERHVRMVFVTHLHEFAHDVYERNAGNVLFLRADRKADGTRTFKLMEAEPLQTSFGEDLYDRIFRPCEDTGSEGQADRRRAGSG